MGKPVRKLAICRTQATWLGLGIAAAVAAIAVGEAGAAGNGHKPNVTLTLNSRSHTVPLGKSIVLTARAQVLQSGSRRLPGGRRRELGLSERPPGRPLFKQVGSCPLTGAITTCRFTVKSPSRSGQAQFRAGIGEVDRSFVVSRVVTVTYVAGAKLPTTVALSAAGADRSENLSTGALTCTGRGMSFGTSCQTTWPENSSLPAEVKIDQPLPQGWKLELGYDPGTGLQTVASTTTGQDVKATVHTPMKSEEAEVGLAATVVTPGGNTGAALGIILCNSSDAGCPSPSP